MKDCCSNQEDAVGEVFKELLKNYVPVWIIFALATFACILWKSRGQKNFAERKRKLSDDKVKEE